MEFLRTSTPLELHLLKKRLPPSAICTYYWAENHSGVELKDVVDTLQPLLQGSVDKLCSAQGKTVKQALAKKGATLLKILESASPRDRFEDLTKLLGSAEKEFTKRYIAKARGELCDALASSKFTTVKKIQNLLQQHHLYPIVRAPLGSYLRFYDSIKRCDEEYIEAGARNHIKIRFNFKNARETVEINGKKVSLPSGTQVMACDNNIIWVEQNARFVAVYEDGSAVFYGTGNRMKGFIDCWNDDVLNTTEVIGKVCSTCMWCGREISAERSLANHAGPVCSGRYAKVLNALPGPVRGADVQPTAAHRETRDFLDPSTTTKISIPLRVVQASPLLQDMMEIQEEDEGSGVVGVVHDALGIDPAYFAVLDDILASPKACPIDLSVIKQCMVAADKLNIQQALDVLEDRFVERCAFSWKKHCSQEFLDGAKAACSALKASGPPSDIPVPKRTRVYMLYCDFLHAFGQGNIARMRQLVNDEGASPNPSKFTKSQWSSVECVHSIAEKAAPDVLKTALDLGLEVSRIPSVFKRSWAHPEQYKVFVDHGCDPLEPLSKALSKSESAEPLQMILEAVGGSLEMKQEYIDKAAKNQSPIAYQWLLQRGFVEKTEESLLYLAKNAPTAAYLEETLPLFGLPASKDHITAAFENQKNGFTTHTCTAFFKMPAYKRFLDAELLEEIVKHRRLWLSQISKIVLENYLDNYDGVIDAARHLVPDRTILECFIEKKNYQLSYTDFKVIGLELTIDLVQNFDPHAFVAAVKQLDGGKDDMMMKILKDIVDNFCSKYHFLFDKYKRAFEAVGHAILDAASTPLAFHKISSEGARACPALAQRINSMVS